MRGTRDNGCEMMLRQTKASRGVVRVAAVATGCSGVCELVDKVWFYRASRSVQI